jgi:hypothetical protein
LIWKSKPAEKRSVEIIVYTFILISSGALTNRIGVPRRKANWINKTGIARSAMLPWGGDKTLYLI